jgi:ferric-dicitrate binding protein FerR (iron transport regulator)
MSKRTRNPARPAATEAASREYRKPRADVYTVLLVVALLMLLLGTAALWMRMKEDYNYEIKGGPNPVWHQPATGTALDARSGIA